MTENDTAFRLRRRLAPVARTLAAWLAAVLVVVILLSLFGAQLASLPLAARALLMSGVLVILMVNVVMPAVGLAIGRWVAGGQPSRGGPAA